MTKSLFAENQASVPCAKCHRAIRLDDSRSDLKVMNKLYRLRCPRFECRFVDWYMECEFLCNHGPAIAPGPTLPDRDVKAS
jgi:hypothetical protein